MRVVVACALAFVSASSALAQTHGDTIKINSTTGRLQGVAYIPDVDPVLDAKGKPILPGLMSDVNAKLAGVSDLHLSDDQMTQIREGSGRLDCGGPKDANGLLMPDGMHVMTVAHLAFLDVGKHQLAKNCTLMPATQAKIMQLIKVKSDADHMPAFSAFAEACTWPDHPRKRAPEHFVNLSRDATSLTNTCGVADKCVVSAIAEDLAILSSKTAGEVDRSKSLRFLGHWVGDVHQPLHVSFEDDRGGNQITVVGDCRGNLHAAWDTCLVIEAIGDNVQDAAAKLLAAVTAEQIQAWTRSDPRQWANESFKITESAKTRYCVKHGNSCEKPDVSVRIDQAYIDANVPIVKEQLQKAGIRLAALLDKALGD